MDDDRGVSPARKVEPIHGSLDSTPVSDELQKLTTMLRPLCPKDSHISFEFDGSLHVHVDLRRFEDLTAVEAILPTICGGIFHDVRRGIAERHSFFHRLTADVER